MILVSACLAGINCRYDGKNNICEKVVELISKGEAIPVCPEQLGGLTTPRTPAELKDGKVINKDGENVTEHFIRGAQETLKLAKMLKCSKAILKQRSPSCGFGKIYDGSHSGVIIKGMGLTAKLLSEYGIKILSEEDLNQSES